MKCLQMAMVKFNSSTSDVASGLDKSINTINYQKRSKDIKISTLQEYADYWNIKLSELIALGE
jgi:hypothetical protein